MIGDIHALRPPQRGKSEVSSGCGRFKTFIRFGDGLGLPFRCFISCAQPGPDGGSLATVG